MKKLLYTTLVAFLVVPITASAATFSFTPSIGTYTPGQTFTVGVYVNPNAGEEITTAKLSATFPANVLEVVSFTQASGWMTLTQPGYDTLNNSSGTVIKTGGYPARVKTSTLFGTLTVTARSAGSASIATTNDSLLLNATNTNTYTSGSLANFTIVAPEPIAVVAPIATIAEQDESVAIAVVAESEVQTAVSETPETSPEEVLTDEAGMEGEAQLAAAAAAGEGGMWVYIIALLVLLGAGVGGWFAWRRFM